MGRNEEDLEEVSKREPCSKSCKYRKKKKKWGKRSEENMDEMETRNEEDMGETEMEVRNEEDLEEVSKREPCGKSCKYRKKKKKWGKRSEEDMGEMETRNEEDMGETEMEV